MMTQPSLATLPVVLVVDDDPGARELVSRQLRGLALVVEAEGGEEALDMARQFRFDLVISDLDMPRGDGATLLRALEDIDPQGRRVLVTGSLSPEIDLLLGDGVVDAYIAKPLPGLRLREVVCRLLSYSSSRRP